MPYPVRLPIALVILSNAACSEEPAVQQTRPSTSDASRSDGADRNQRKDAAVERMETSVDGVSLEAGHCVPGESIGAATAVACGQRSTGRLAVDSQNVYWTVEEGGPVVMKAPHLGGPPEVLVNDANGAFGIALDPNYVYFSQPAAGRLMRVAISGAGGGVPIATGVDSPLHLASDSKYLYFTGGRSTGSVQRLELRDGAVPVTLVSGLSAPRAIAVDDAYVYWTDVNEGAVMRAPKDIQDGAPMIVRIGFGLKQPSDLVVAAGYAYFPDHSGRVLRVAAAGGLPEELAQVSAAPFGLAVDGANLYFTTLGDGGVFRVPVTGERVVVTMASAQPDPHFLAVSPTSVYWGNWGNGGSIAKVPR